MMEYRRRRRLAALAALLVGLVSPAMLIGQSKPKTLDAAIDEAVQEIISGVPEGSRVAVITMESQNKTISNYIIDELISKLVKTRNFQVASRSEVEKQMAMDELDFQADYVDEESQKRLGRALTADTLIWGSYTSDPSGPDFRLVIRAMHAENFSYQATYTGSVQQTPDYTWGEKFLAAGLNIFFGTGSFIQKDWFGGIVVAGGMGLGAGLILYDILGLKYEDDAAGVVGPIGISIAGAAVGFGFIRPLFLYHKPAGQVGRVSVMVVPGSMGIQSMTLSYSYSF